MANQTDGGASGYSFQWKIENVSHCWLKLGEAITSPTFTTDALENTKWSMSLYPMGFHDENYISFYLHREVESTGPTDIEVSFQLAFLGKGSLILEQEHGTKQIFQKPKRWGFSEFMPRGTVFSTKKVDFLPDDTLTVQCTISKTETIPPKPKYFFARTILKASRRSFLWRIDPFSSPKSSMRYEFKDQLIGFDLILSGGLDLEKKLAIHINSLDERVKYFSFKTSIIESEGRKENGPALEYSVDDLRRGMLSSMPLLTKKLMENKSQYFSNDVLCLSCEILISSQIDLYEFFESGKTFPKTANQVDGSVNEHRTEKEKIVSVPALRDLKIMYNDAIFSDTELRASGKSFPAHKNILSARSPVFRRMFSHDMKEKNTGHVDIPDLEENTVQRMLQYMYTDSLADLQIESALKLYSAADKYEIMSLKIECSSYMKRNLCPAKACEVLLLADRYQDVDLKCFVQDYILQNDREVFGSQEWKDLMETNLKLAADIMYKKVYPM